MSKAKATKSCTVCQKTYMPRRDTSRFCSRRCALSILPRKGRKKTGKFVECEHCGKRFYVRAFRVKKFNVRFCSRSCLAKVHLPQFADFRFQKIGRPPRKYKVTTVNGKKIREHRHVLQQQLGRKLETWEHVHHKDGNGLNNDPSNLEVLSNSDHQKKEHVHRKRILALRRVIPSCLSETSRP